MDKFKYTIDHIFDLAKFIWLHRKGNKSIFVIRCWYFIAIALIGVYAFAFYADSNGNWHLSISTAVLGWSEIIFLLIVSLFTAYVLYLFNRDTYAEYRKKAIAKIAQEQFLHSISPITQFSEFERLYSKHGVKEFVDNDDYRKIRSIISDSSKGNVRLLGLSGTGKTFIIQSAFIEGGNTAKVFYCDNVRTGDIITGAANLSRQVDNATLILDNCPRDVYESVLQKVGDSIRLVSAYYDPTERANGCNLLYLDNGNLDIVVQTIVEQNLSREITQEQKNYLIHHSGNIPFMALLLVQAFNKLQGITDSFDRDLKEHLLDIQGEYPNEQRHVMRTISLCQPLEYAGGNAEQFRFLRDSENFTPIATNLNRNILFKKVINRLKERNLIESDSVYINMRPQPLAIWLVSEWIKEQGAGLMDSILELASQPKQLYAPLLDSWARRLEFMQDNQDAINLYSELLKVNGGPFANEDVVCSDFGSRLILAMSTVNPVAVAECYFAVLFRQSIEWLHDNLIGDARRNVVRTLEKICFCKDSFHLSTMVCARLALAENENWSNNSTGLFNQLFHVFLAGTESNLEDRIAVLKDLYEQGQEFHTLLLSAIKGAFTIEHLSRIGGAEKFGFKKLDDYCPNGIEITNYWNELYTLLCGWIDMEPHCLTDVAEIIQLNTRHFIRGGKPELLFKFIDTLAPKLNYEWNEMHKSLVETNNYDHPSHVVMDKISYWIEKLTPKDIVGRMKIAVHEIYIKERRGEDIMKKEEEISIPFAAEFLEKKAYLTKEMDTLINDDEGYLSWAFTMHLAHNLPIDEIEPMGEYIKKIVFKNIKTFYSSFIVALYRQIPNKQRTKHFIIDLYNAQYYALALPLLAVTDDEERQNLTFVLKQVKNGIISSDEVRKYFSAIRLHKSSEILTVLNILHDNGSDLQLEFDFIAEYWFMDDLYHNEDLLNKYKSILIRYPIVDNTHYNYEYTRQVDNVLKKTNDRGFAKEINRKLINALSCHITHNGLEDLYDVLLTKYRGDIWPEFIEALTDIDNRSKFFFQIRYKIGAGFDFGEKALFQGHEEEMKEVCKNYPKYGPWVCAAMCPVFDQASKETGEIESFHPFAIWLLENYGRDQNILDEFHANLCTFHWAGSTLPLYEDRRRCFENLLHNPKLPTSVKEWIKKCLVANKSDYDREAQNEAYTKMAYNNH